MRFRAPAPARVLGLCGALIAVAACGDTEVVQPIPVEPDVLPVQPFLTGMQVLNPMEGYAEVGPIAEGWVVGPSGNPMPVTYEIHDGVAIWQGDIELGDADEIAPTREALDLAASGPFRGVIIEGAGFRWPGGVIPYEIAGDLPNQARVTQAIDMVEDMTPGVTLVPRDGETDYVRFVTATGCSSPIGRQGDMQRIRLADFCSAGNTAHEILHALGMYHTHTRCDRDSFVTIDYSIIQDGRAFNFFAAGSNTQDGACGADQAVRDVGAYDFGSIMHYSLTAFSTTGGQTITPIVAVPPGTTIGQRTQISDTDAATIDDLYGANNAPPTVVMAPLDASYPEGSLVSFDASASTDDDDDDDLLSFTWTFGDGTCPGELRCSDPDPVNAYDDNGTYAWSVTVDDGFDAAGVGGSVLITNVAPSVAAGVDVVIDEGQQLDRSASFTDPGAADTWSATVDYGEGAGTQALPLSGYSYTLKNLYEDNPTAPATAYTVDVTVTDDDGGSGQDEVEVTVNNVAPAVDAGLGALLTSGESFELSGGFGDPGVLDAPWDWVITWNDGRAPATTTGSNTDQLDPIEATRQFCEAGNYTIVLAVTDKDGGTGTDDVVVTVQYQEVPIRIQFGPGEVNPINLSRGGAVPVVILSTPVFDATSLDPATLQLGDELGGFDTPVDTRGRGDWAVSIEDVDENSLPDLVAMFSVPDLVGNGDLDAASTQLVLRGVQQAGCVNVRGVDDVTIRP